MQGWSKKAQSKGGVNSRRIITSYHPLVTRLDFGRFFKPSSKTQSMHCVFWSAADAGKRVFTACMLCTGDNTLDHSLGSGFQVRQQVKYLLTRECVQ